MFTFCTYTPFKQQPKALVFSRLKIAILKIWTFLRFFVNAYSGWPAKQRHALLRNVLERPQTRWKRTWTMYKRHRKNFLKSKSARFCSSKWTLLGFSPPHFKRNLPGKRQSGVIQIVVMHQTFRWNVKLVLRLFLPTRRSYGTHFLFFRPVGTFGR